MSSESPRKWRFTWEAQSSTPTLKLFLFDSHTKPSNHCNNLEVELNISKSHLLVRWIVEGGDKVSVRVPIPRVLIDPESPVSFRALCDHIEVRLVLLLPVDHPIVSCFGSALSDEREDNGAIDAVTPLIMDSDLKSFSSMEGVHFYCRSCSARLTSSPLKHFVEMPSVNWREVADNWFGACCCSFGGISEKLVYRYVDAYACAHGVCLLNSTAVTLCKDDVVGCNFADSNGIHKHEPKEDFVSENGLSEEAVPDFGTNSEGVANFDNQNEIMHDANGKLKASHLKFEDLSVNTKSRVIEEETDGDGLSSVLPALESFQNLAQRPRCCDSACPTEDVDEVVLHDVHRPSLVDQKSTKTVELLANKKSFLNGFLGNVFMTRSYNLSMDVEWKQFSCPQCLSIIGAYPCSNDDAPLDGGVRLFKCYLSTSLPAGGSGDLFRKYTLERMFVNQLLESAKDELSFRTVVRDLTTKSPMLQVVLLNPNSWHCSGECLDADTIEFGSKLDLQPVIKVLFADCGGNTESRVLENWITKNQADEVFMLAPLIEELIKIVVSAKDMLPSSCTFLQGLSLSSMLR